MTDRTPWWYSGDDEGPGEPVDERPSEPDGDAAPAMDWMTLLTGAARMVDWATSAVMAPHAEHQDPADYPQCVVCRTLVLVGDPVAPPAEGPAPAEPITWIPIRD